MFDWLDAESFPLNVYIVQSTRSVSNQDAAVVCRVDEGCDDLDLKLSKAWLRIAIAGVFAGQGMVFSFALNLTPPPFGTLPYWILHGGLVFSSLVVMAFLGGPLFTSTWAMLLRRRLSIEGLFTVSLLGAFVGSLVGSITGRGDVFYEIVAIVIAIYTFGRLLGERSQARLRSETAGLRARFDRANVLLESGEWGDCSVSEVEVGGRVRVEPGEAFSVDGVIVAGVGYVEETALTGEPLPVVRRPGETVRAGTWSRDARFEVEVRSVLGDREIDRILDDVEGADGTPSELQTQANQLVAYFLPIVVCVSLLTALFWGIRGSWVDAVLNSMAVLLVACPCALGLATPVALAQGLFRLANMGIVSRNGNLVDALARTRCVFFDKTGTLSESSLRVSEFWMDSDHQSNRGRLLGAVFQAEKRLAHPVGRSLVQYIEQHEFDFDVSVSAVRLVAGKGVSFELSLGEVTSMIEVGNVGFASNPKALQRAQSELHDLTGKQVFVFVDGAPCACFVLAERLRLGVQSIWSELDELGVRSEVLTGDPSPQISLPDSVPIYCNLQPGEKEARVRDSERSGEVPLFVGDGINDSTAMAAASGSLAMGSGSGLARSIAIGQLNGDRIEVIPEAIRLARLIHQRLKGNLRYAAGYNLVGMALAAGGLLHPILAALIMLVSSFAVTVRSIKGLSG